MNNTFSFERFGKVLAMDFKNYIRNYGISLIVLCSLPIALWILSLIFGTESGTIGRGSLLVCIVFVACILAPSKVYGKANLTREGVAFAMLPASALEKFFSMFIFCAIVTPIVCLFGGWAIDSLLTLTPFGGFKEFVNMFAASQLCEIDEVEGAIQPAAFITPFKVWFAIISGLLIWSAVFMLGNMIFKKRKAGKTLACYLGISYVISTLISVILLNNESLIKRLSITSSDDASAIEHYVTNAMNWGSSISVVLLLVVLFFVYRKIKTQKY